MFDGVKMPSSRVQAVVRVGSFLSTCLLEADKHRREHARASTPGDISLEEILKKAGLRIPDVQAALRNLMGDGPASAAANDVLKVAQTHPDLAKMAQELVRLAGRGEGGAKEEAAKDPAGTEPKKEAPPSPTPAPASTAPATADEPKRPPEPSTVTRSRFRPEYTAQGRLAALGKASADSPPAPSSTEPREAVAPVRVDAPETPEPVFAECSARLSALEKAVERLVSRVETSLGDLRARVEQLEVRMAPPAPPLLEAEAASAPTGPSTATASVEPPPLVEPRPERRHPDVPAPSAAPAAVTIKSEPAMVRAVDPAALGSPSAAPANAGAGDALSMGAPSVPELAVEEPGDKDAEAALALLGDEGGQP